jgi:hypothetical protein
MLREALFASQSLRPNTSNSPLAIVHQKSKHLHALPDAVLLDKRPMFFCRLDPVFGQFGGICAQTAAKMQRQSHH